MTTPYERFLESKAVSAPERGYIGDLNLNPDLKPHARDIAAWMIRGGNRACFASFGLHKTSIQLQICESLLDANPEASALVVCPLGVRREFMKEQVARGFPRRPVYLRTSAEFQELRAVGHQLFLTNYERIRDGNLDPNLFTICTLDEAAVLRSFGSKTYQTFLPLFNRVPFKFVATATPSPNRYKELIHYAGFLGIMDTGQALTRFFKRDSSQAGNLTIHPHKEREFWLWVSTWATFLTTPSQLGYSDAGYVLPPLDIQRHRLPVDYATAGYDSWNQGKLYRNAATSLSDAAREKRDSLADRLSKLRELVNEITGRDRSLPEGLQGTEQGEVGRIETGTRQARLSGAQGAIRRKIETLERAEPGTVPGGDETLSTPQPGEGDPHQPGMVCQQQGPSERDKPNEETAELRAYTRIVRCDAEGTSRSLLDLPKTDEPAISGSRPSDGRREGVALSDVQCGVGAVSGQSGLAPEGNRIPQFIVWCDLNAEQRGIEHLLKEMGISCTSLYGAMDIDDREDELERWLNCETTALVTKPIMYGSGVNLQQCHIAIFFGIGYKFQDFIQAVSRTQRFGQKHVVQLHLIYTESEDPVHDALMRKWKEHDKLHETMAKIIQEFGLNQAKASAEMRRSIGVSRQESKGDLYTTVHNDNVPEVAQLAENSVDLIVTSWPFSDHYEYTESYNDFGHNDGDKGFFEQMEFLTPELIRALGPGRMYCVHAKDRIVYGSVSGDGMYTVNPFSDKCVAHCIKHGLRYCGRITVATDVVRENNQTYRLGFSENAKDGTKMGVGSPEYVLLFRKLPTDHSKGYADRPVPKSKEDYTRARWQLDAHAFWRSNGNRFLTPEEIGTMPMDDLRRLWHQYSKAHVYDYGEHVRISEEMEKRGILPASFMALNPPNPGSPWIWDGVARMKTLNTNQGRKGWEQHVCPLQIDIVERLIERFCAKGELVLDPFSGLGTVPYCAVLQGRRGYGIELNEQYWKDSKAYCHAAECKVTMPTLFDMEPTEDTTE